MAALVLDYVDILLLVLSVLFCVYCLSLDRLGLFFVLCYFYEDSVIYRHVFEILVRLDGLVIDAGIFNLLQF